jgi:hypothetical protein
MPPKTASSALVLFIRRDDGRDGRKAYYVERISPTPAITGRCWRLTQTSGVSYDVTEHEGDVRCECKGYLRWGHCKHVDAVLERLA